MMGWMEVKRGRLLYHISTIILALLATGLVASAFAESADSLAGKWLDDPAPVPGDAPKEEYSGPKKKKVVAVMLDAGHGGDDLGAQSESGYVEKDLALVLAKAVGKAIVPFAARRGISLAVRYTRESDSFVSLVDRVDLANGADVDLFVSIHGNHSPSKKVSGFEAYFASDRGTDAAAEALARKENGASAMLAGASPVNAMLAELRMSKHLQDSSEFAETVYRGVAGAMKHQKGRGVRQGPFKVISGTEMPAVLLEVGYLSNEKESEQLDKGAYRSRLADAIARGILEYVATRVPHG